MRIVAISNGDLHSRAKKRAGDPQTDAARATRHDSHFASQVLHVLTFLVLREPCKPIRATMRCMKQIAGKVALVAVEDADIASGIASALASAGATVLPLSLDIANRVAVDEAARVVSTEYGAVDILCAGTPSVGSLRFTGATLEQWGRALGASIEGVVNVLTAFLPAMKARARGGHVVNLVNASAFVPDRGSCVEATCGFGVRGLTDSLRFSLARHGIGVSLVCRDGPQAIGDRVLLAIQANESLSFGGLELLPELQAATRRTLAAIPNEYPDPRRAALEERRRALKRAAIRT
jgi:NADP-dependent 3-hydroxy acid dehydrogenase YdfG